MIEVDKTKLVWIGMFSILFAFILLFYTLIFGLNELIVIIAMSCAFGGLFWAIICIELFGIIEI